MDNMQVMEEKKETGGKFVVEREIGGKIIRLETGEVAKQANGAVLVKLGDTMILCTATMSRDAREGIDFFPLMVDYEEKMYAAGKIPGGFIKREGRPSEGAILSARLVDRPLRPLFPEGMRNEVQLVCLVLSADQENQPNIPALIGSSAALALSGIPVMEIIGAVRIALVEGEMIVNPTFEQSAVAQMDMVVAGTKDSIMMVESAAHEVDEEDILKALELAHQNIKLIVESIEELKQKAGKPPLEVKMELNCPIMEKFIRENLQPTIAKYMRITEKQQRETAFDGLKDEFLKIVESLEEGELKTHLLTLMEDPKKNDFKNIVKKIEEEELRVMIVDEGIRPDGRTTTQIRPLSGRVALLPRAHGSGLFTRGQTQVLTAITLAPLSEGQEIDGIGVEEVKRYMHQYNFPPFSVGETRPMRGPGRREIGHGNLAERALLAVLPSEEDFPYAMRLVSEVLESNGSTSMASVCGSTLALMDAGVPIKKPVAGIAMGLILKEDKFAVLTDIQGMEDALGEMDFKVAGTRDGVTAMQMDIKVAGISIDIMRQALAQAKDARMEILKVITDTIAEPRPDLSPYAPRIFTMLIDPMKIKDVIGPGGKIINKIIDETGVKIDIENDGTIFIASNNLEMAEKAKAMIYELVREPEVGEIYQGTVVRIANFGAFVELMPGKEGMVRIGDMSTERIDKVQDVLNIGDKIMVQIDEIDSSNRINLKLPEVEKLKKMRSSSSPRRMDDSRPSRYPSSGGSRGGDRGRSGDRGGMNRGRR